MVQLLECGSPRSQWRVKEHYGYLRLTLVPWSQSQRLALKLSQGEKVGTICNIALFGQPHHDPCDKMNRVRGSANLSTETQEAAHPRPPTELLDGLPTWSINTDRSDANRSLSRESALSLQVVRLSRNSLLASSRRASSRRASTAPIACLARGKRGRSLSAEMLPTEVFQGPSFCCSISFIGRMSPLNKNQRLGP